MSIVRVKYKIARLGILSSDIGAVGVLGVGAAAMTDDVVAVGGVIDHPVHKARTVQAVGTVGPSGGTSRGCYMQRYMF